MTRHPLDIFADNWKSVEEQYFAEQPASIDFSEISLNGNTNTDSQIKDWNSKRSIDNQKIMDNWDHTKPYVHDTNEEPEIKIFQRLLSSDTIPETIPDFGYFELHKSAKLTDFISGSFLEQYGLIVNSETKEILAQSNIGLSKFYPLTLELKGQKASDYYFLKTTARADNYIDFHKSRFYEQNGLLRFETRKEINLNSIDEINAYRETLVGTDKMILAKEIFLNSDFPDFDYFTFSSYGIHKKFISKKLAKELSKATGIEVKQTNRIHK